MSLDETKRASIDEEQLALVILPFSVLIVELSDAALPL
jgi:hypothetical protein